MTRVLQVGLGRFGKRHFDSWTRLQQSGRVQLVGVVVATHHHRDALADELELPVFAGLDDALLEDVDAVDIVTPASTHAALIRTCLPRAHVLVEKPLASTLTDANALERLARTSGKHLMVGHLYRFDPLVQWLRETLVQLGPPWRIEGEMVTPAALDHGAPDVVLEKLHFLDVLDLLDSSGVALGQRRTVSGRHAIVDIITNAGNQARFELGYVGDEKIRRLSVSSGPDRLECDFVRRRAEVHLENQVVHTHSFEHQPHSLDLQLAHFLDVVEDRATSFPDPTVGRRIVEMVERLQRPSAKARARVAVVGGGLFGATCAAELVRAGHAVTLFEREPKLLSRASRVNQQRHHLGAHYPWSDATVQQCQRALPAFMEVFGDAVRTVPSFYALARGNPSITPAEYAAFVERNHLEACVDWPAEHLLAANEVEACWRVPEAVYDLGSMREIATRRLEDVEVVLGADVIGGTLTPEGPHLQVRAGETLAERAFDHVVNATYAGSNQIARWFGFPTRPLWIGRRVLAWVRLDIGPVSLAVWDGDDFATLVATETEGLFTMAHRPTNILDAGLPADGLPPSPPAEDPDVITAMQQACARWFPVVAQAEIVRVEAIEMAHGAWLADFGRTSDLVDHGFGCWSVLGGKMVTCVHTARSVVEAIGGSEQLRA